MKHFAEKPIEGKTDTWLTPQYIIQSLGPFDLDPCAAPSPRPFPTAQKHIELPDDGLETEWDGLVWMNPPYGAQTGFWLNRLAAHKTGGIALVFARTETRMFHEHVWRKASSILFLAGRIRFLRRDGSQGEHAAAPSCLIGYGEEATRRLQKCNLPGKFINLLETAA